MFRNIAEVCVSRNVVMTEESISNWKSNFLSVENVQKYLIVEKENEDEAYCEMREVEYLAQLMMDPIEDDNDVRCGKLYHWEFRSQCTLPPPSDINSVITVSKDPSQWHHGAFWDLGINGCITLALWSTA